VSGSKDLYILGYAGHAFVVIEAAVESGWNVKGYFDFEPALNNPFKLPYMGFEKKVVLKSIVSGHSVFPAIGNNFIRRKLIELLESEKISQAIISEPSARISKSVTIGLSTLVSANASINAMAQIGKACIINTGSIVEHECKLDDFVHIAPGSVLAGNVRIGDNSFIGANSVLKENISIGKNVVIGAGSVVLKDVADNETWIGNPAKRIK
jgi:UDP-N-acetylbacillosamine N-acetyltransferase